MNIRIIAESNKHNTIMRTLIYNRSEVMSFYELNSMNQTELLNLYGENAIEDSYVEIKYKNGVREALPLSMLIKTDNKFRNHGYFTSTNTSAYCVTLSRCGSEAIVSIVC